MNVQELFYKHFKVCENELWWKLVLIYTNRTRTRGHKEFCLDASQYSSTATHTEDVYMFLLVILDTSYQ